MWKMCELRDKLTSKFLYKTIEGGCAVTTEHYRNFIAIVDAGSILGASNVLRIAQPALSNQLKTMEQEFQCRLVTRKSRGITLTEAGKILYQKAKSLVELEDAAKSEIHDRQLGVDGTLSIALPPTSSVSFLHEIFFDYQQSYPKVRLELYELNSDEVARYVRNGTAEIGFIRAPIRNPHLFDLYPMPGEEITVFLPESHPLTRKKVLFPADLQQVRLAIPRGCVTPIQELCAQHAFVPEISFVTTSRTAAIELAQLFDCAALVPEGEQGTPPGFTVRYFSSKAPELPRALILRKNAELSLLAQNFLQCQSCFTGRISQKLIVNT